MPRKSCVWKRSLPTRRNEADLICERDNGCPDSDSFCIHKGKAEMVKKVELLAPAGNREAFYGALHAGADAVYLGGAKFGARAFAENFSGDELLECIRYAHVLGRRVYLTVNTLLRETELGELYEYLSPCCDAGLDGVIVQDIGAFLYIREQFPLLPLHVSTQMTVTGRYGAKLLADMGAVRIVPARELSLKEIRGMKEACGLEMETFIHGAMCYCYSGQCLFSSILGGRSGNRGRCAQPCRLPYTVEAGGRAGGECYPLSLKDMCTIEHLPKLIRAGIDSFKIEGRMKKPEYAAGVTAIYRKYIDRCYEQMEKGQDFGDALTIENEDMEALSTLYIRSQRQDGYYFRQNGRDMVTLENPAYAAADEALLSRIRERYLGRKLTTEIQISAAFRIGEPAVVTFSAGGRQVTARGEMVQPAQKQPVSRENIERQLSKLGDSPFQAGQVKLLLDQGAFYPLKALNELRREAAGLLEEELIRAAGLDLESRRRARENEQRGSNRLPERTDLRNEAQGHNTNISQTHTAIAMPAMRVSLRTREQLEALAKIDWKELPALLERVYIEADLCVGSAGERWLNTLKKLSEHTECFLALPAILRDSDSAYLNQVSELLRQPGQGECFRGCMVRSLGGFAYLRQSGYRGAVSADAGVYVWNLKTLDFWKDKLDCFCLPLELNAGEQRILEERSPVSPEKMIYGRIPMMVTANCVAKTTGQCRRNGQSGSAVLTDRLGKKFPVELNCVHCMNIIYNSVPLSLHAAAAGQRAHGRRRARSRLDFTVETGRETEEILKYFAGVLAGRESGRPPYKEYTTGHEKRGAE